jgi:hypothetical protein
MVFFCEVWDPKKRRNPSLKVMGNNVGHTNLVFADIPIPLSADEFRHRRRASWQ